MKKVYTVYMTKYVLCLSFIFVSVFALAEEKKKKERFVDRAADGTEQILDGVKDGGREVGHGFRKIFAPKRAAKAEKKAKKKTHKVEAVSETKE